MESSTSVMGNLSQLLSGDRPPQHLSTFSFVMNVVICGSLSVAGTACNTLSIIVLQSDRGKLSMTVLLQGLELSDSLFLFYTFFYTTLRTTGQLQNTLFDRCVVAFILPIGWIAQTTSIWIVCMVTVDRYLYICHPFWADKLFTVRKAFALVVSAFAVSVCFNIPRFVHYYEQSFGVNSTEDDNEGTFVAYTDSSNWSYRYVYDIGFTWALLFLVPLPLLVTLNLRLIRVVADAKRRQVELTGTKCEKETLAVTLNLVVIVTVFILCECPDFVASIVMLKEINPKTIYMEYFLCVKEFLLVLNASVNFFIYCCFYDKFRRNLRRMLTRRCCGDDDPRNKSSFDCGHLSEIDLQQMRRLTDDANDSNHKIVLNHLTA